MRRLIALCILCMIALAVLPGSTLAAVVDNGNGTKTDTFNGITVTTPVTYGYCTDAPKTDYVTVSGLTGSGYSLVGHIQVDYVLTGGGRQIVSTVTIAQTGTNFQTPLNYVSPFEWPVAADLGNGLVTKEIHVDLALEVLDSNGNLVYTFGPGLDWDVFCTGNFPPPPPPPPGVNGCTPGYWKNHTSRWTNPPTVYPNQPIAQVFSSASIYGLGNNTLLDGLKFKGGPGSKGAAYILLRAATAAYLNSIYLNYPLTTNSIQSQVNAALSSQDRSAMLSLASLLDLDNNLGCPLN
jgi:hypothetical protein